MLCSARIALLHRPVNPSCQSSAEEKTQTCSCWQNVFSLKRKEDVTEVVGSTFLAPEQSGCTGSNEEPYANIWEEISNVNTAVPKSEEFKTFPLSKVSFKRKNATEDEEKSPLNQEEKPFRRNMSSHKKSSVSSNIRTALQKPGKKMKTWLRRVLHKKKSDMEAVGSTGAPLERGSVTSLAINPLISTPDAPAAPTSHLSLFPSHETPSPIKMAGPACNTSDEKPNAVCKEEQAEESSQSKGIWSIPSLIDYLASASDSSTFCEGAQSAESSSESVCPTLVPAGLEATVPHSNTPPEEVPSMESCQSEDIWFTPPSHIENEVPSMESCQSEDIWFTLPSCYVRGGPSVPGLLRHNMLSQGRDALDNQQLPASQGRGTWPVPLPAMHVKTGEEPSQAESDALF